MEFTIYKKSWRRGGGNAENSIIGGVRQMGDTELLNEFNMFCCLGMIDAQLDVNPQGLIGAGCPEDVDEGHIPQICVLVKGSVFDGIRDTKLSTEAIKINDDSDLSDAQREKKLTSLFSKFGHKLTFVNRLAPKKWRVA